MRIEGELKEPEDELEKIGMKEAKQWA